MTSSQTVDPIIISESTNDDVQDRLIASPMYYELEEQEPEYTVMQRLTSKRRLSLLCISIVQAALLSFLIMSNVHSALDMWICPRFYGNFFNVAIALLFVEIVGALISTAMLVLNLTIKKHTLFTRSLNLLSVFSSMILLIGKIVLIARKPRDICPLMPSDSTMWLGGATVVSGFMLFYSIVQFSIVACVSDQPRVEEKIEETQKEEKIEVDEQPSQS